MITMVTMFGVVADVAARHAAKHKVGVRLATSFMEGDDIDSRCVRVVFGPPLHKSIDFDAEVSGIADIVRDWVDRELTRLLEGP